MNVMNLKTGKGLLPALLLLLTAALYSCDKVPAPYSTVASNIDTTLYPPPSFSINPNAPRKVLIEDYTGHTCGNCPDAAVVLKNILASNPNVVALAVHAGSTFAPPQPPKYPDDWRTEVGTAFDNRFGVSSAGQPNGLINRRSVSGSPIVFHTSWANLVNQYLSEDPIADVELGIKTYFDPSTRRLVTYVHSGFVETIAEEVNLGVYLVEDSIVGAQKWYNQGLVDDYMHDYVHMDMLRQNISPVWGVSLGANNAAGKILRREWQMVVPAEFHAEHLKVLAFVYKVSNNEVIQATDVHIIE